MVTNKCDMFRLKSREKWVSGQLQISVLAIRMECRHSSLKRKEWVSDEEIGMGVGKDQTTLTPFISGTNVAGSVLMDASSIKTSGQSITSRAREAAERQVVQIWRPSGQLHVPIHPCDIEKHNRRTMPKTKWANVPHQHSLQRRPVSPCISQTP